MKITVISPNQAHLREMGVILESNGHSVALLEGGKSRMRTAAEQEHPDVMVVDGLCCDPAELVQVEHVTTHHPGIAVILLCATQTPEFLINSMRAGVREVLPSPSPRPALEAAIGRVAAKLAGRGAALGKVLAYVPCKGGSGATFLATNLGYQLAETRSVLVIDLNLQFGDALSFVYDGKPASTIADVSRDISRLDASLLAACTVKVSPNFSVLAAPEDLADAMEVKPEHIDAIISVAVTQYDFVLLDLSRNLDTLAIKALDRAQRIYLVLQAGLAQVRNAGKLLEVFRSLGYAPDKIELIVNRFEKTADIGVEQIVRALRPIAVSTVPNAYKAVNTAINQGDPLLKAAPSNAVARQLGTLASNLNPRQDESPSLMSRLFRRA